MGESSFLFSDVGNNVLNAFLMITTFSLVKPLNPLSLIILASVTAAGKPCDKGQSHATDR